MKCPHCEHELTAKEIGALYAGLRKTKGGGRPRLVRCPCGAMTLANAMRRGHKCVTRFSPAALAIRPMNKH